MATLIIEDGPGYEYSIGYLNESGTLVTEKELSIGKTVMFKDGTVLALHTEYCTVSATGGCEIVNVSDGKLDYGIVVTGDNATVTIDN